MRSNVRRLVMDQVTKVRQHFKREEWKSIISECRASGMTVSAWCKANGIVDEYSCAAEPPVRCGESHQSGL